MDNDEDYPSSVNRYTSKSFTPDVIKDYDTSQESEKYRLIEFYSKVKVPYYRIVNAQNGQTQVVDANALEAMLASKEMVQAYEQGILDVVEVKQTRVKLTAVLGQIVLYEKILDTSTYPIIPVPNIWTNTPYPMSDVRKNKDFQRFLNKTVSLITSHAQASSGLKLLIPQGSVQDVEELERDWANPNATIEYDPSFGEPHFPSPQPLASSIMQLPALIEKYIDLNMGIFEMMQGNTEVAPRTSSATMMMEDFGQRRSKSKLRDIEGSLKRLGKVIYSMSKAHYTFEKTIRIAQPNNELTEYAINKRLFDDKTMALQTIENDITSGEFDIRIIGNSTMPSNKWGEWQIYMEAFQAGLIDKTEALKKTEIFDKEGVLSRTDEVAQLQGMVQQLQEQLKQVSGDLQTAQRESVNSNKRAEVEKFKGRMKGIELESKAANKLSTSRLKDVVNLEKEKIKANGVQTNFSEPQEETL